MTLTFVRDGNTQSATLRPDAQGKYEIGDIGVLPDATPIVASLIKGDLAEKAGLKAGDVVVAVNGERMVQRSQLTDAISRNADKPTDLTIRRNGQEMHIEVTPQKRGDRGMIGIYISEPTKSFKPGPFEAVKLSVQRNIEMGGLIFKTLGGLFVGTTSPRQLMGPVAIAQLSGRVGAGRVDRALHADGVDQPQPRAAQPDADSPCSTAATSSSWRSRVSRAATSARRSRRRCCWPGLC